MLRTLAFYVGLFSTVVSSTVFAASGDPVALRSWPGGGVSIEAHSGLQLMLAGEAAKDTAKGARQADITLDWNTSYDHHLSRSFSQADPEWKQVSDEAPSTSQGISVRSLEDFSVDGSSQPILVSVDGLKIALVASPWTGIEPNKVPAAADGNAVADVLVFVGNGDRESFQPWVKSWTQSFQPAMVVWAGADSKQPASTVDSLKVTRDVMARACGATASSVSHNTLALSASGIGGLKDRPLIQLGSEPWKMPEELSVLFEAMERSCDQSQSVFAKLTAEQMNFKPSNGTHTPRWNTEHMMGRQLLFFSQIYHQVDASVPVMNLNPAQMPPDYRAAHPRWDGAEEARQMQRVSQFCRRFAYLLEGVDVNTKAPGSRWPTLKALLVQMERHYQEHTANTVKKFELPDWPKS